MTPLASIARIALSLLLTLMLSVVFVLPLSGCAESAGSEQTADALDDIESKAAADKIMYNEQLELKKAELAQKELELESAEGMLRALKAEAHPDEDLVATYEQLVEKTKKDIDELKVEIAWLEGTIGELDEQLNDPEATPSSRSRNGTMEDLLAQEAQQAQEAQEAQEALEAQEAETEQQAPEGFEGIPLEELSLEEIPDDSTSSSSIPGASESQQ
jgi:chromosome segregation ATPase